MLKIKQLSAVLIFLLAHNPVRADAEFSDKAKRLEKFSAEYTDEPDHESWKAKQGRR